MSASHLLVESEFVGEKDEVSLEHVICEEVSPTQPILICSMAGHDGSVLIEQMPASSRCLSKSIALGSSEGFQQAEQSIKNAAQAGKWVMLKNAHLAPIWLGQLEKKLSTLALSSSQQSTGNIDEFRLFISLEITQSIPTNLLRMGRVIMVEASSGLIGNVKRVLTSIRQERMDRVPKERSVLYLALIWLHSIILERIRYIPYGWTKVYDFSEADLQCGLDVIDVWLDRTAGQKTNVVNLADIPWSALRALLKQCVYGARIDNDYDRKILDSMIDSLFGEQLFHPNYDLARMTIVNRVAGEAEETTTNTPPRLCDKKTVERWVDSLPLHELSPLWIGLGKSADQLLLLNSAFKTCAKFKIMMNGAASALSHIDADVNTATHSFTSFDSLIKFADRWLKLLPSNCERSSERSNNSNNSQLDELINSEIEQASDLLHLVRSNLQNVVVSAKIASKIILTNELRQLSSDLSKGLIPSHWKHYPIPDEGGDGVMVEQWLTDFKHRIEHFNSIGSAQTLPLNLGYFFNPQAFFTVTRRMASQQMQCPIDQLKLIIGVDDTATTTTTNSSFFIKITGLRIDGTGVAISRTADQKLPLLQLSDDENDVNLELNNLTLKWLLPSSSSTTNDTIPTVNLPVYLNRSRSTEPIINLDFQIAQDTHAHQYWLRGCALLLSAI